MPSKNQITGLVLAGGRGARMENADKGLQLFNGKPLILHVIQRFAPQVEKLIISANRNLEIYRQFNAPVYLDELSGFAGPLAGLQTGLCHCDTDYLVAVPCDAPFLPHDLVIRLGDALTEQNADLAFAVTGKDETRRAQPIFTLLKTSLLPHLTAYLEAGNRKVQAWHASLKVAEVYFENESDFRNLNTLEDLHNANE